MQIEVKLFATFRRGRWKSKVLNVDDEATIEDILKLLDIETSSLGIAMVNGSHSSVDARLKENDVLAIFPPSGGG